MEKKLENRRSFLKTLVATSALPLAPAFVRQANAQSALEKIRLSYVHTSAVDSQMWLMKHRGLFEKEGLDPSFHIAQSGLDQFQALAGGSVDFVVSGAPIGNQPSKGLGKVFLLNGIEYKTAQLWVHPDMGIKTMADLKGKDIATSIGGTSHIFLHRALEAHGLDSRKDVNVIAQRMPDAVATFIAKKVPAVALWVPFDISVKKNVPDAIKLSDASDYYPKAAILGGWVASNDIHAEKPEVLKSVVRAWNGANDYLLDHTDEALDLLQKKNYEFVPLQSLSEEFAASKRMHGKEWISMIEEGTVNQWLNQMTEFLAEINAIRNPLNSSEYFDQKIMFDVIGS